MKMLKASITRYFEFLILITLIRSIFGKVKYITDNKQTCYWPSYDSPKRAWNRQNCCDYEQNSVECYKEK